jgi:hypothetical protein
VIPLNPDAEIESPQKNAKDTKRMGFEDFPSRHFCGLKSPDKKPKKEPGLPQAP